MVALLATGGAFANGAPPDSVGVQETSRSSKKSVSAANEIISKHTVRFTKPPRRIPSTYAVDAPLLGNGFTGVSIGGTPELQTFYIARNDFWRLSHGHNKSYPAMPGKIELSIPALKGGTYLIEQNLYEATTTGRFQKGEIVVTFKLYTAATEDLIVAEIAQESGTPVSGTVKLLFPSKKEVVNRPPLDITYPEIRTTGGNGKDFFTIRRGFGNDTDIPASSYTALRTIGFDNNGFSLQAGKKVSFVCATGSNFKNTNITQLEKQIADDNHLAGLAEKHKQWWANFWEKSFVSIPDKEVERAYYQGLYTMASTSRDLDFPSGLFGMWITQEQPAWSGDYHLNYNFNAPFYALYSANRIEQADPYNNPILAFLERGKYYSEKIAGIPDGVIYPVGIGPLGIETTRWWEGMEKHRKGWRTSGNVEHDGMFWGQKSNAAYALVNVMMQFYHTYDKAYAQRVWPFVKAVATFWEKYPRLENGRYVIYKDAIHEGTVGNKNPVLSIGFVKMTMQLARDMSEYLGVDADRRANWKHVSEHISAYPTMTRGGKIIYRLAEAGPAWYDGNSLATQHIYPAGQIGLFSPAAELAIARETVRQKNCWFDSNSSNSHFPAAVRVGLEPELILQKLRAYVGRSSPNGFPVGNPHGIENCSTIPNTINEMLCTAHQGVLRVFHVWPKKQDAAFWNIRVEGAFLVTASLKNGEVGTVEIFSEKGRDLELLNPWGAAAVEVREVSGSVGSGGSVGSVGSGGTSKLYEGGRIRFSTKSGTTYKVQKHEK